MLSMIHCIATYLYFSVLPVPGVASWSEFYISNVSSCAEECAGVASQASLARII